MGKTIGQQINEYRDIITTLTPEISDLRKSVAGLEIELSKAKVQQANLLMKERQIELEARSKPFRLFIQVPINGIKELWRIFKTFVYGIFKWATGEAGKYLAIAIVIGLMIYGGISLAKPSFNISTTAKTTIEKNKWGTKYNPKSEEEYQKLEAARRSNMSKAELAKSQFDDLMGQFSELFDFGYRINAIKRLFGTFNEPTIERPRFTTGRCNNVDMLETVKVDGNASEGTYKGAAAADQKTGNCKTIYKPNPIEWEIDTSKLGSNWSELPDSIREDLSDRTKVYIPYIKDTEDGNMGSFWVPDCNHATYKKRITENGKEREEDTALPTQLLEKNNYVTCKLAKIPARIYTGSTVNGAAVNSLPANYSAAFCPAPTVR